MNKKAMLEIIQPIGIPGSGMRKDQRSISPTCLCQETSGPARDLVTGVAWRTEGSCNEPLHANMQLG